MSAVDERISEREKVESLLESFDDYDFDSLERPELGQLSFTEVMPTIVEATALLGTLLESDLRPLSKNQLTRLIKNITQLRDSFKLIEGFTVSTANPKTVRDEIVSKVVACVNTLIDTQAPVIAFLSTQSGAMQRIEQRVQGALADLQVDAGEAVSKLHEFERKGSQALETLQEQTAQSGVERNGVYYANAEAVENRAATSWLIATVVMLAATGVVMLVVVGMAYAAAFLPMISFSTAKAVQLIGANLVAVSTVSFAAVWCARNYRARKHNATVNQHRKNALSTFKAFVEGTDTAQVKDAILVSAADAAFSARPTGYDAAEPDGGPTAVQAESLLRLASRSAGSSGS